MATRTGTNTAESTRANLVVGVAASASACDALFAMLGALPARCGMTFLLGHPNLDAQCSSALAAHTRLSVRRAEPGAPLLPDVVYLPPPGASLVVREGRVQLVPLAERGAPSLNPLFASLAEELRSEAAAVVLSGPGIDGSAGIREVRTAGGLTIAQDPRSATQSAMPQSAIDTGCVDLVLEPEAIPEALARFRSLPAPARLEPTRDVAPEAHEPVPVIDAELLGSLTSVLETQANFDLRVYKTGTVERRLARRMTLTGHPDLRAYLEALQQDPEEQGALVRDLLISVTDFFRDTEAFDTLRAMVIDPLVSAAAGEPLRLWVTGCATGEEAYSLAIEVLEASRRHGLSTPVQIFATDVDRRALGVARAGVYPPAIADRIPAEVLQRYFDELDGRGYQVKQELRDLVSFAAHDLTRDPPFSRMHLVSCRNVLIYLRPAAQEQVIRTLHFALQPNGALILGSSESSGAQRDLFSTVSKKWRIYRKVGPSRPLRLTSTPSLASWGAIPSRPLRDRRQQREPTFSDLARRAVLAARVPPCIVVGQSGRVLFMHGDLRPFLRFPDGDPCFDLANLVHPDLATRARAALYKCRRDQRTVVAISNSHPERGERVRIVASPAFELGDSAVILSFDSISDTTGEAGAVAESPSHDAVIEELERELAATREDLRNTVEELESSNEELLSSNEETMSLNEELQSANEELEATAEELRSLNEELTSTNAQLREKVELLEQAHDDLSNFFSGTQIATLFLDERLRIKRTTPAADHLLRLGRSEQGRFVGDIARELLENGLADQARRVLEQLSDESYEMQTRDGTWIVRRVLPYRTESRRIEGVVVTFLDVTDLKRATEQLNVRTRRQAVIARLGARALDDTDLQGFLDQVVRELQQALGADVASVLELQPGGELLLLRAGAGWSDGAVGTAVVPAGLGSLSGFTLSARRPVLVHDLSADARFSGSTLLLEQGVHTAISCVLRSGDEAYGVLDVAFRAARELGDEEANFVQSIAAVVVGAVSRHEIRVRLAVENAIARALGDAATLQDAASLSFADVAEVLGPGVGELWEPSGDGLARTAMFAAPPYNGVEVERDLSPVGVSPLEGLVGRVYTRGRAEWFSSLQRPQWLVRVEAARRLGLVSGVAFPIVCRGRTIAVWMYLASRRFHANALLLRSLDGAGRSMGDFAQRLEIERRFRLTFTKAPVGIADRALDGRWLRVNERFCDITGRAASVVCGSLTSFAHPEDLPQEEALLSRLRSGDMESGSLELRYLRADGELAWVGLSASVVSREEPAYCVVIVQDITARKNAEAELLESENRFREALLGSPVPMMLHTHDGEVLLMNRAWTDVTGYSVAACPRIDVWLRAAFGEGNEHPEVFVLDGPEPADPRAELDIRTSAGTYRTLIFSSVHVGETASGTGLRVVAAADVTEQRETERDLLAASRHKDEFIGMLGHELRNPLAAVRSATELLRRTHPNDERVQRTQGVLERQTAHMAKLLDGLLDVSRVVRGKIALSVQTLDLGALVAAVLDDAELRLAGSNVELQRVLPVEPVWVEGDAMRLRQMLENLLANAVKFTPTRGTITVDLIERDEMAVLRVSDTGVGIDPDLLPHLFEPFQQGQQTLDRSSGGLGLGLAMVKLLADLHGGDVRASSGGSGQGAELVLRIPLTGRRPAASGESPRSTGAKRILIIEDNEDAAEMLRSVLELRGHDVLTTSRGRHGIELAQEHLPDLIICDLGLPDGITGYDVAESLRAHPATRALRLIALSGYGRPEDKSRCASAGFDSHLTKPVSVDDLERIL